MDKEPPFNHEIRGSSTGLSASGEPTSLSTQRQRSCAAVVIVDICYLSLLERSELPVTTEKIGVEKMGRSLAKPMDKIAYRYS